MAAALPLEQHLLEQRHVARDGDKGGARHQRRLLWHRVLRHAYAADAHAPAPHDDRGSVVGGSVSAAVTDRQRRCALAHLAHPRVGSLLALRRQPLGAVLYLCVQCRAHPPKVAHHSPLDREPLELLDFARLRLAPRPLRRRDPRASRARLAATRPRLPVQPGGRRHVGSPHTRLGRRTCKQRRRRLARRGRCREQPRRGAPPEGARRVVGPSAKVLRGAQQLPLREQSPSKRRLGRRSGEHCGAVAEESAQRRQRLGRAGVHLQHLQQLRLLGRRQAHPSKERKQLVAQPAGGGGGGLALALAGGWLCGRDDAEGGVDALDALRCELALREARREERLPLRCRDEPRAVR
mmetsp:Transcript_43142/g.142803  ORF Transcript_43142/g.142803 Transcript_43142/m.142803 type:complete len:351 (-) Transcript_43142:417-1469(-)